jgi:hypothetical protein
MNRVFEGLSPELFTERYSSADECYRFLEISKWENGFVCRKCGHTNYCTGKKPFSRRCTRCKAEESVTANTVFHGCRLPVTDAFRILFSICCNPQISAYKISKDECIRGMTCWKLRKKIVNWMEEKGSIIEKQ